VIIKRNNLFFLWHGLFLALTMNFIELNTVAPDLILKAGGSSFELGILTAIMIGGAGFMQLLFAAFLHRRPYKKPWLLTGINLRIISLLLLGLLLFPGIVPINVAFQTPWVILLLIALFSFSGSFANISYMDLLGRTIQPEDRKTFFLKRQLLFSIVVFISALLVRMILDRWAYPLSHGVLFLMAASLLWIASWGFWMVKEPKNEETTKAVSQILKDLWQQFGQRGNLRSYLILSNIAGVSILFIPFVIAQAKDNFTVDNRQVGNYLMVQVVSSIVINLLLQWLKPKRPERPYRYLLISYIVAGALLPLTALILVNYPRLYFINFILSSIIISLHQMILPAIQLEISHGGNRAWVTAIVGAFNIMALIYPLAAGFLMDRWGYLPVFIGTSFLILTAIIPARKMNCSDPKNLYVPDIIKSR
jgi:MFS family permease